MLYEICSLQTSVQDQDSFGGGFDSSQAFHGKLAQLNWFADRLTSIQIAQVGQTAQVLLSAKLL